MRLARATAVAWCRAALDAGALILDGTGQRLDPDGRDYERVREALDELLADLES